MQNKKTVSYYLPLQVVEHIENEARKDNRTPSNFLANHFASQIEEAAGENTPAA